MESSYLLSLLILLVLGFPPPVQLGLDLSSSLEAMEGDTVELYCQIGHTTNQTISWLRADTLTILSAGRYTFTKNRRYIADYKEKEDAWVLKIRMLEMADRGDYQCQGSGETEVTYTVTLDVRARTSHHQDLTRASKLWVDPSVRSVGHLDTVDMDTREGRDPVIHGKSRTYPEVTAIEKIRDNILFIKNPPIVTPAIKRHGKKTSVLKGEDVGMNIVHVRHTHLTDKQETLGHANSMEEILGDTTSIDESHTIMTAKEENHKSKTNTDEGNRVTIPILGSPSGSIIVEGGSEDWNHMVERHTITEDGTNKNRETTEDNNDKLESVEEVKDGIVPMEGMVLDVTFTVEEVTHWDDIRGSLVVPGLCLGMVLVCLMSLGAVRTFRDCSEVTGSREVNGRRQGSHQGRGRNGRQEGGQGKEAVQV